MFLLKLSLTQLIRDWRAGELRLIGLALIIAVASLTTVDFFTDRVNQVTEIQATELLAADLVVSSAEPFRPEFIEQARGMGLNTALTVSFRSVVVFDDRLELAEVKAVQTGYPLRGRLLVSEQLFSEEIASHTIPEPGAVWPDPRLFQLLDFSIGDKVNLGASSLHVTKVLTYEPDRGGDMFNIAPRLLMNLADLDATDLIRPGSRATYRLLVSGPGEAVTGFRNLIDEYDEYDIRGIRDARPELRTALDRAEQFLGLAVLVSIALAGLAIALSAQRYVVRHFDNCAIMRCFGADQGMIIKIYFIQLAILALICSGIGCVFGYLGQSGLTALMRGLVSRPVPEPGLAPILVGMAAGMVTVLGFAMPQILRLKNVTPLRVLRRDLVPLPLSNLGIYAAAIGCLLLLAPWKPGNMELILYGFIGLAITGVSSLLATRLAIRWLNTLRSGVGVAARFGLANIVRRAGLSTAQILAISIGVMVLTLLVLIRTDLLANWHNRLPPDTPNYFLINIQPDEVGAVRQFIDKRTGMAPLTYPMIRARLTTINGKAVNPDDYTEDRAKRFARRTFNLSIAESLQDDNRLTAGNWWGETDKNLFSFEEEFAATLGISLGDRLEFKIADKRVTGTVSNTRWVDWDTFNVNFFVVANPGTLDGYPASYITSFHVAPENRRLLIELLRTWPSITVFDVDSILRQVRGIMEQVAKAVEFVSGFTLLAGVIVLLAALQTTHDERRHETALLNTLGARRSHVLYGLLAEFALLGLIAGVVAALTATVAEILLAEYVFHMDIVINPWVWLITPLLSTLVVVAGGLAGTQKVISTPPILALRQS